MAKINEVASVTMNTSIGALIIAVVGVIGTLTASIVSQVLSARARREELELQRLYRHDEYDREQARSQLETQRKITLDFILAIDNVHGLLRKVAAQSMDTSELATAVREAVGSSGIYGTREQMLISVPPEVAVAAETAWNALDVIRRAVSNGSKLDSIHYHQAYADWAEATWTLRQAARQAFRLAPLDVDEIRRLDA